MDLWTIVLGLGIGVLSSILIWCITAMSKERSYDEVIAEQRRRQEAEREKVRSDKKLEKEFMKKKYKKGKGDKIKEKAAQASAELKPTKAQAQKEPKMVNLEIEPEIIEPTQSVTLGSKKGKNNPNARKRSILHNKDEVTPVTEEAVELPHKPIKPLDDVELKKMHDAKKNEVPAAKKGKGRQTNQKQLVKETQVENEIQKTKATSVQHEVAVEEKGTKSKGSTVANGSPLVNTLRTAELSDAEVQSLIEVLLHRQGADVDFQGSWNKKGQKGDPVATMKKQMEETEKALQEEQQLAVSLTKQVKELRTSLTAEREKTSAIEKRHHSQLSQQEAEKEALKARLSNTHTTHMADTAKLRLQLEQLEGEKSAEAASCLKLKQENKILQESLSKAVVDNASKGDISGLKQKVSIMEKELSNNAVRLNAAENAKKSSEEKLKKYQEQIKEMESSKKSSEDSLKKQLTETKEEKRKADSQNTQLNDDLKKATGALSTVEAECAMWKTKLQELEKHLSSLGDISAKLQQSEEKKQEVESNLKNLEKQLADSVRCRQDVSTELQQVRQENSALSQELKVMQEKQQTSSAVNTNGDIHEDKDAKNFIETAEHERIVSEKMTELSKVQAALDAQTKKNNEEVKEAVAETEKADRGVLKRLFPAVSLSDSMEHKEWLSSFEKQAIQLLERSSSSENKEQAKSVHVEEEYQQLLKNSSETNTSLCQDVSRLKEENENLQSRLQEKEENMAEVEKKLHNLERVVETEEKKWKEKVRQAEEAVTKAQESESSSREKELEDVMVQQQSQIEHYRTVLTNTEQLLRQLESAEKTWEEKLQTSQSELQKSQTDCQKAQEELHALRGSTEDLSDLGFAYRCVEKSLTSIVDEMQGKMEDLEEELRQSHEKLDVLTKENETLTSKVIVMESQSKAVVQVGIEDMNKELEEVRRQLEGERKRNKELSSTLVRLNGIIKTGQDALSQEQKLVQQLQEQLTDRAKDTGSSANQEIEQLRSKLSEKEKQLEREIAANRQLSQRLGQLGVLGTPTGSDQGSSV